MGFGLRAAFGALQSRCCVRVCGGGRSTRGSSWILWSSSPERSHLQTNLLRIKLQDLHAGALWRAEGDVCSPNSSAQKAGSALGAWCVWGCSQVFSAGMMGEVQDAVAASGRVPSMSSCPFSEDAAGGKGLGGALRVVARTNIEMANCDRCWD